MGAICGMFIEQWATCDARNDSLLQCNLAIASCRGRQQEKEDGQEVFEWANKRLRDAYKGSDKAAIVEGTLRKLSAQ